MLRWPGKRSQTRMRSGPRMAVVTSAALVAGLLPLGVASQATADGQGTLQGADEPAPIVLAQFEGAEPLGTPPIGLFNWGSDADDPPTLELQARPNAPQGEKVLAGTYDISG